jgi:hypothetical protein
MRCTRVKKVNMNNYRGLNLLFGTSAIMLSETTGSLAGAHMWL